MPSFLASIRGRVSLLVAGMAVLASVVIGIGYLATEQERIDVQEDGRTVSELYDLATQLTDAIHDQEAAIDDHLVLASDEAVARYRQSVAIEDRVAERIRADAGEFPDVMDATASIVGTSETWRLKFAEPAIEAVSSGSRERIDRIIQLEDALAARTETESVAVLMIDLDHFKDFNDRYGHPAGDEALRVFAGVLRSCLREGDVAARYGGEEFAVMLPAIDEATAAAIAERIRSRTESTVISLAPGITDRIRVSIGIAVAPVQAQDRITLLRLADEALYRAKQAGRNRVEPGVVVRERKRPRAASA
jgi:diguanylate cyclase (GGDEF)-like protein